MFSFSIIDNPGFDIDKEIVHKIFVQIHKSIDKIQKGTVNLVFLPASSIQKLNKDYRQKDEITDVLSFHYLDDFSLSQDDDVVGEIIFCEEKIISQGQEFGLGTEKEFYKLLIHSLLHILGYDHESDADHAIMAPFEQEIWDTIFA